MFSALLLCQLWAPVHVWGPVQVLPQPYYNAPIYSVEPLPVYPPGYYIRPQPITVIQPFQIEYVQPKPPLWRMGRAWERFWKGN